MLFVHRHEGGQDAHFLADVVLPQVGEDKFQIIQFVTGLYFQLPGKIDFLARLHLEERAPEDRVQYCCLETEAYASNQGYPVRP